MKKILTYLFFCLIAANLWGQSSTCIPWPHADSIENRSAFNGQRLYFRNDGISEAIYDTANGRAQDALDSLNLFGFNLRDADLWATKAIVFSHLSEPDSVQKYLDSAMVNLFSFERLAIPNTDLLAPLQAHPRYTFWKEQKDIAILGKLLGDVTDRAAAWRVYMPDTSAVKLKITNAGNGQSFFLTGANSENLNHVVRIQTNALNPSTEYDYQIMVSDSLLPEKYRFSTLPEEHTASDSLVVVFGGCSMYLPFWEQHFLLIDSIGPDLVLNLGDIHYIDWEGQDVRRYIWYQRILSPCFQQVFDEIPLIAIWDDHEFFDNDSEGETLSINFPERRDTAIIVWKEMIPALSYGVTEHTGVYRTLRFDRMAFHLTDSRYYRNSGSTSDADPTRTMLGAYQREWLIKELNDTTALNFLCISVPWNLDNSDKFKGYKFERDSIIAKGIHRPQGPTFSGDFETFPHDTIGGVIILTSDRHYLGRTRYGAGAFGGQNYFLHEFLSGVQSNINRADPGGEGSTQFGTNERNGFGTITIKTAQADPSVRYEILTYNSMNFALEKIHSFSVQLSEITP